MEYIDRLMKEVDANVKELIDVFRFLLKYKALFRGSGIEFAGLREYVQGEDDASRIEWKASLRSNRFYVKQFEEERNLDIYILVDTSSSMLFGTQEKLKSEYSAVVAGTLAYAAIESGDNVGFGMFSKDINISLAPSGDISQYYIILKNLVDPRFYGGLCNLEGALSYVLNSIGEKTALFIISDFIGIGDKWKNNFKAVSGKLDGVFGIMIRDITDSHLPEGVGNIRLSDSFSENNVLMVDMDRLKKDYEKEALKQELGIQKEFINVGAGFVKVYTNEPFAKPLVEYLQLTQEY